MYSTIGNSTVPSSSSTLISVSAGSQTTLPFYSTQGAAVTVTQLSGLFDQVVVQNGGTVIAYASVDSGVTWVVIPAGQSIVFRRRSMNTNLSVVVAAASGGGNVTNISAWTS